MGQVLLLLVVALTVGAVVFGVTVVVTGRDPGLVPVEPDGRAVPLPGGRPLRESDVGAVRFDTAPRGYRMDQVDQALRRAAYDVGYKSELIEVLAAEVAALRDGRADEAEALRRTREQAVAGAAGPRPAGPDLPPGSALAGGPAVPDAAGEPALSGAAGEPAVTGVAGEPARAAADEPTT
ncbi:DivIVA domain-containing protein, partial [Micromonospora fluostatini]